MPSVLNLDGIALTPQQGKLRRIAEQVAREVLEPNAMEVDRSGSFPAQNIRALGEAGLLGIAAPEEYGGAGSIVTCTLVTEVLARACASTAMCYHMHQSTLPLICAAANEQQINDFIQPVIRGETLGGFAMSEPGSGNRIWHMDSYAVADGDHYIIDSFKSFATSSGHADFYLVPVRANDTVGPTDLSLFYIDGKDKNIEPKGEWDGLGLRGNSSRPIHFNKCRVPAANRIGEPTEGFSFMMAYALPIYIIGMAACYMGIAQAAMDASLAHVKKRVHSDTKRSLATVETVQRYVAEMHLRVDRTRAAVLRVAQMADNATVLFNEFREAELLDEIIRENPDDPFFVELAEAKVIATEAAMEVANIALQVCGGIAYKRGHPVERHYRDARAGALMGPSDDALKVIIGNQLLGLPQPWA